MRRITLPPFVHSGPEQVAPPPPPLFPVTFGPMASHSDWRSTWTHIVAGKFSSSQYSCLFFYDQSDRYAEFYETDGRGGIFFIQNYSNWQNSWTHIVSGAFSGAHASGLFFYDQEAGFAAIYDIYNGNLTKVREYPGWPTSWTHITTLAIPGSAYSGLLLYDQAAGYIEIHKCSWSGELQRIYQSDGLPTTWTHVVGDSISGGTFAVGETTGGGVLFYNASTSHAEIYAVSVDGGFQQFAALDGLPPASHIIGGNFGWFDTGFLFYDRVSGSATFVYSDIVFGAILVSNENYSGLRMSWDLIVSGAFWANDPDDVVFPNPFASLLFYDQAAGYGEFYFHLPFDSIASVPLEGFACPSSVAPADTINFYVNSRVGPYSISIFRQDKTEDGVLMTTVQNNQTLPQPFPIGSLDYRNGPSWPPVASLEIPQDWPSGLYLARVQTLDQVLSPETPETAIAARRKLRGHPEGRAVRRVIRPPVDDLVIPFVVRAAVPGSQSEILLYIPDTTYAAYNFWGGRSLYGFTAMNFPVFTSPGSGDSASPRAIRVSLNRPYRDVFQIAQWRQWEVPLIRWLARRGIAIELCTATDIHKDGAGDKSLLQNYRLLVSVGHDEYWSKETRDNVESFADAGGNVAFFSANVCWWQIRFDLNADQPNADRQICYKDANLDPLAQSTDTSVVTVNWYNSPVNQPETSLTGVSYHNPTDPSSLYRVLQPNHWVFAGLNFDSTSFFGAYKVLQSVVGPETDKYQADSHPPNFLRLASIPPLKDPRNTDPKVDAGTMGIFTHGKGQVFTVGTINWSLGLSQDEDGGWNEIDQITLNVFNHLQ